MTSGRSLGSVSQRKQLGAALRSFRRDAAIDRDDAARMLDVSPATLTRIERGETRLKRQDVVALAEAYGIPDSERDALIEMLRETRMRRGQYPAFYSVKTRSALDMEADASEILYSHNDLIPAHFQTEAYMRALFEAHSPAVEQLEQQVAARLNRQSVVTQERPPTIRAVIHENALRLPIGGPAAMHRQLRRLVELTDLDNIEIQVQPIDAGAYPGIGISFMLLRFDNNTAADLVQVTSHGDSFYRDRANATEPYRLAWDQQRVSALSLPASKSLILSLAADMERRTTQ